MFCKLIVDESSIVPTGLSKQWPKRVIRYLAPLDFEQQSDTDLGALMGMFKQVPMPDHYHGATLKAVPMPQAHGILSL